MKTEDIKRAVRLAAKIHNKSYNPGDGAWSGKYMLGMDQSAFMACQQLGLDTEIAPLISIALEGWWNDTLEWADKTLRSSRWKKQHRTPRCYDAFYLSAEFRGGHKDC